MLQGLLRNHVYHRNQSQYHAYQKNQSPRMPEESITILRVPQESFFQVENMLLVESLAKNWRKPGITINAIESNLNCSTFSDDRKYPHPTSQSTFCLHKNVWPQNILAPRISWLMQLSELCKFIPVQGFDDMKVVDEVESL